MKIRHFSFVLTVFLSMVLIPSCTMANSNSGFFNTPASGDLLFEDDFSGRKSGWGMMERAGGDIEIAYGGMLFTVDLPNFMFWSVTGRNHTDTRVEVDAVLVEGPEDDAYGVICRYQDEDNFYGLMISHDGYFGIFKYIDGNMVMGSEDGKLGYSEAIRQGGVVNHIQAICQGDVLSLTVNDTLLAAVVDESFTTGKVGLLAGTYTEPGVTVLFDNFKVYQP